MRSVRVHRSHHRSVRWSAKIKEGWLQFKLTKRRPRSHCYVQLHPISKLNFLKAVFFMHSDRLFKKFKLIRMHKKSTLQNHYRIGAQVLLRTKTNLVLLRTARVFSQATIASVKYSKWMDSSISSRAFCRLLGDEFRRKTINNVLVFLWKKHVTSPTIGFCHIVRKM